MKYTCHEDGVEFEDLESLQKHLKSKTAWSNSSLVGCRVSVLLENREWSEGLVSQYHRSSGKHCVEFRHSGARRWLVMLRTAFYIVDRSGSGSGSAVVVATPTSTKTTGNLPAAPCVTSSNSASATGSSTSSTAATGEETKEPESDSGSGGNAPWTYAEDLSLFYAKAQSTMHACYGGRIQETGHKTLGHTCVTEDDKRAANESHGSLLYGELLPRGVNKALDERHLDARRATVLFDLGMGTGKVAMQSFLQFPNVRRVFGVELSSARYRLAEEAMLNLARDASHEPHVKLQHRGPNSMTLVKTTTKQTLEIARGNLFHTKDVELADVILLETEIPADAFAHFSALLDAARDGARILTYLDLRKVWQLPGRPFPFRQLESNRSFADRYATSWSVHRGHHLFLWVKVLKPSNAHHFDLNLSALVSSHGSSGGGSGGSSGSGASQGSSSLQHGSAHQGSSSSSSSSNNNNNNNGNNGNNNGGSGKSVSTKKKTHGAAQAVTKTSPLARQYYPSQQSGATSPPASRRRQQQRPTWTEEVACQPKWPTLVSRNAPATTKKYSRSSGGTCVVS